MLGNRRRAGLCLAVALAVSIAAPAAADSNVSFNISIHANASDPADALMLGAAAAFFGLSTDVVARYRTPGDSYGYFSVLFAAGESRVAPDVIVVERKKGRPWAEIYRAHRVGPPGLWISEKAKEHGKKKGHGKHDHDDDDDDDDHTIIIIRDPDYQLASTIRFIARYYAIDEYIVIAWVRRGIPVGDIAVAANLARRARVAPSEVIDLRRRGLAWSTIAVRYRVPLSEIQKPVAPSSRYSGTIRVR